MLKISTILSANRLQNSTGIGHVGMLCITAEDAASAMMTVISAARSGVITLVWLRIGRLRVRGHDHLYGKSSDA